MSTKLPLDSEVSRCDFWCMPLPVERTVICQIMRHQKREKLHKRKKKTTMASG